jgi:deoxyribose-phosphate aldolase
MPQTWTPSAIAKTIDHSLLHPTLTDEGIIEGCRIAVQYDVATVCVKPYSIPLVKKHIVGSRVGICSVVTFPHGNATTSMKVREAEDAMDAGATEIDMVVNIGKVLGGDWEYVSHEIGDMQSAVEKRNCILKVIFETDYLQDQQVIRLCEICTGHSVAFVKTSTGYGFVKRPDGMYSYAGATDHFLRLMRKHCGPKVAIKAAGGIRTLDDVLRVLDLGVTRIGATATKEIMEEAERRNPNI